MVARAGGQVQSPWAFNVDSFKAWAKNPSGGNMNTFSVGSAGVTLMSLLRQFMEAKDVPPWTE
jgi:hypothetical protein